MAATIQRKEEKEAIKWKLELSLNQAVEGLERAAQDFNKLGERLQILPQGARFSSNMDLEIKVNPAANHVEQVRCTPSGIVHRPQPNSSLRRAVDLVCESQRSRSYRTTYRVCQKPSP